MTRSFSGLGLRPALLENLSSLEYTRMTAVQAACLPDLLKGADLIVQARTGSGKTAAFGLGLLQRLDVGRFRVQSMVLCPTRELADQVARELRRLARGVHNVKILLLCGGMPFGPQLGSLEHGAHIVVGTPGRLEEHLRKSSLDPAAISCLVLDEADRMLDMGFQEAIRTIAGFLPGKRQTLLFSATYPDHIKALAADLMRNPRIVTVDTPADISSIRQAFYRVEQNKQRLTALRLLLLKLRPESALVFCNTRLECGEVAEGLREEGFSAIALHGDLQQRERDEALTRFANRSVSLLVATDVAARGLDIDDLDAVFNFHVARDPETHVHRVGRTGRAGKKGLACTIYSDREQHRIDRLAEYLERDIRPEALPPYSLLEKAGYAASMVTLQIDGGRKQKVRPGDILGALTGKEGIAGKQVGKIDIFDHFAYVAVDRAAARPALRKLRDGKIKGRSFRARRVHG